MTAQVRMMPSSAPTVEEMAKRLHDSRPLPLCTNVPFQHMEEVFLLTVYHDLDCTPDTYDISKKSPHYHAWNRGDWNYIGIEIILARHPDANDALWGIQDNSGAEFFAQTMHNLCAEIMQRIDGGASRHTDDTPPLAVDVPATILIETDDDPPARPAAEGQILVYMEDDDLHKPTTPRIAQKPPKRIEYIFSHAGLDPSSIEDAFAFLTAPWNDEYRRSLGISWNNADYAAQWIHRQPEVVYHGIHQQPPVIIDQIPLPSEDVAR